jgi:hypothetical protein
MTMCYRVIICVLLAITSATARIGESPSQCKSRYGDPIAVDQANNRASYHFNGIHITAYFLRDRVQRIVYSKTPTGRSADRLPLSEEELTAFLRASSIAPWTPGGETEDGLPTFASGDLLAVYNPEKLSLIIATKEWIDHVAAQEKDRLSGF